jgi:putative PIN family toxin of toxin-antitoxin system
VVRVVIDTNVFLSGLRSKNGASFKFLHLVGKNLFTVCVSVPLVLEYESILKRNSREIGLTYQDIDDILDYICSIAEHRSIYYLWRPFLPDPKDDMVLELAVESEADIICTFNIRDFSGADQFDINVLTPQKLLQTIGEGKNEHN